MMQKYSHLFILNGLLCFFMAREVASRCKWDVYNCGHEEIICDPEEGVYLDSKEIDIEEKDHCYAINDDDKGEFRNYEIEADLLSLESVEGMNTGTVGLMFNYQDSMNYDFMYLQ